MAPSDSLRQLERLWPGPQPYTESQAKDFFGRNGEIGAALDRIYGQRLTVLHAPSAAGKTSLLRAGIVPELRYARLEALETHKSPSGRPFPMLLNQWLGRVGSERTMDFAKLLLFEAHRHLVACAPWYKAEADVAAGEPGYVEALNAEMARINLACTGLRDLGISEGFVSVDSDGSVVPVAVRCLEQVSDSQVTDLLLKINEAVSVAFESVVLILDQFEEVLSDAVLGRQAILAVEAIFRLCPETIRQMISMRHDSAHLLEPLEAGGTLDQKRIMVVYPLTPERVRDIVKEVSDPSGVTWEPDALRRLIDAFTDAPELGKGRRDVNLLGLQVVLKSLFEALERDDTTRVDIDRIALLCKDVADVTGAESIDLKNWLEAHYEPVDGIPTRVRASLAAEAPRRWIEHSLKGVPSSDGPPPLPDGVKESEYEPALIKPMVARMAAWLVTPAGFKRPMTGGELRAIAYGDDLKRLRTDDDLAGRAVRDGLRINDPKLRPILEATFRVALHRLVEVGHVLKGRGSDKDASYELVHDQFGKPLQAWAEAFLATPSADLGFLYATDDIRFRWGRDEGHGDQQGNRPPRVVLADSIEQIGTRPVLDSLKWRGCTIHGVDFAGVVISGSDFSRTAFVDCHFDKSTAFNGCTLSGALFRECEFEGTTLTDSALDATAWRDDTSLKGVTVARGSMAACIVDHIAISDCRFTGNEKSPLNMDNGQFVNAALSGDTTFAFCSLNGVTFETKSDPSKDAPMRPVGNLTLTHCDLNGAEFDGLDFASNNLTLERCVARGAVFTHVSFNGTGHGEFRDVELTGAVFVGCHLPGTCFKGEIRQRKDDLPPSLTPCQTVVIKGTPGLHSFLADAHFANLNMEGFTFSDCQLKGDIEFDDCQLSGGTIEFGPDSSLDARLIRGRLWFHNHCDLAALEFDNLDFSEGRLEVEDSRAASLLLSGVTLPSTEDAQPRARFADCFMPGVLFDNSTVHGLHLLGSEGKPPAHASALIVRGGSFGECVFCNANLENVTFEDVEIDGDLRFEACSLAGGTIACVRPKDTSGTPNTMLVRADLVFTQKCNLRAVEFRGVVFEQGRLIVRDGFCDGMIMVGVTARSQEGNEPVIELTSTSLNGLILLGCDISGLVATGQRTENSLTLGWGVEVRKGDKSMALGNAKFTDLDLDGLVMQGVEVDGLVTFARCTLLRSLFADITSRSEAGRIDVSQSDLLFAQVDEQLRSSAATISPILRMGDGQLDGVTKAAGALKHIKYKAPRR